jgi:hypothetical protein
MNCGRRKRFVYDYYDKKITRRDIVEMTGMNYSTVTDRLGMLKWNVYEAVETPLSLTHKERRKK